MQTAILRPVPPVGSALVFDIDPGVDPRTGLAAIRSEPADVAAVLGIGAPLALALGASIDGLRGCPALGGVGVAFPSTQGALWLFLHGDERGTVLDRAMAIERKLGAGWRLLDEVDALSASTGSISSRTWRRSIGSSACCAGWPAWTTGSSTGSSQ